LLAAPVGLVLPGQAGGRLDGRNDDAQHVQLTPGLAPIARQPGLLQAAQGDGRGGVAGQDDQAGARLEQANAAGLRQIDDLLAGPAAIGRVGLVGEIDEVGLREPLDERTMDGQAAHAGIEDANGHEFAFSALPARRPCAALQAVHVTRGSKGG
jgi:hypothetical protein